MMSPLKRKYLFYRVSLPFDKYIKKKFFIATINFCASRERHAIKFLASTARRAILSEIKNDDVRRKKQQCRNQHKTM